MIADADIWQVMCGGDIYQADLATLKQWIAEGLVQQTDQVRKGNLRWLEAGRVPALRRVFAGEERADAPQPQPAAPAVDPHAQQSHGGFRQAAPDLPVYHAGPPEPAAFAHATQQPAPPQPAAQQYPADTVAPPAQSHAADPFAPPAELYTGDVIAVSPEPSPDAFDDPRFEADPSRYAPETSHYAVASPGFTPESAGYAPAAPSHFGGRGDATQAHDASAPDPFYVPQSDRPDAPAADYAATPQYAHVPDRREFAQRAAAAPSLHALGRFCYAHPQLPPRYICRVCQTPMCQSCAKFMEGDRRTALCPLCGDFCNDYREVYQQARNRVRKASGFGLGDFGEAVGYPFRNLVGLVGISIFYSLLSLGGIKGQVLAYVVIFGCMSLVIKQLAWGRTDRGFLPDFTSWSLWDDVAVPFFLGLGVTIVTIGPAIVLFLALLFGIINGGPSPAARQAAMQREADEYSETVAKMMDPDATEEELRAAEAAIRRQRESEVRGALGEAPRGSLTQSMGAMLGAGVVLVLLLVVALLWAFFYYPMALIVAGYTEDFWAVVNPMVGFDTIKRMGWTYGKVFLMYAAVQLFAVVAGLIVSYALSAFDMPLVGNIPARFIEGGINFYTGLVIAALLGLALYKSSDRLGIETD